MKIVTWYECDVCRARYCTPEEAFACESKPAPPVYPIGLIYGNHQDSMYRNITFAIATEELDGHMNISSSWACRDNSYGDSLDECTCGSGHLILYKCHSRLNKKHPTFIRMVYYLKSRSIPITIWDGKKAVPFK